jgi:hypothetical protein
MRTFIFYLSNLRVFIIEFHQWPCNRALQILAVPKLQLSVPMPHLPCRTHPSNRVAASIVVLGVPHQRKRTVRNTANRKKETVTNVSKLRRTPANDEIEMPERKERKTERKGCHYRKGSRAADMVEAGRGSTAKVLVPRHLHDTW